MWLLTIPATSAKDIPSLSASNVDRASTGTITHWALLNEIQPHLEDAQVVVKGKNTDKRKPNQRDVGTRKHGGLAQNVLGHCKNSNVQIRQNILFIGISVAKIQRNILGIALSHTAINYIQVLKMFSSYTYVLTILVLLFALLANNSHRWSLFRFNKQCTKQLWKQRTGAN